MGRGNTGELIVVKVKPGGSAEACGKISAGMIIQAIDGTVLATQCSVGEAARMIKSSPGKSCSVSLAHPAQPPRAAQPQAAAQESADSLYTVMWATFGEDAAGLAPAAPIAAALQTSGLAQNVLQKVWLAGKQTDGGCGVADKMNKAEFVAACKFAVRSGGVFPITSEA